MAQKVDAQGGVGGDVWDDGVYDGVRKVHVGQGQDGVSFINVVYERNSQEVVGGEHGMKSLIGFETFEVDADDYIVVVQVSYDKIFGYDSDIITSITFSTFKGKTSPPYGLDTEKKFVLKGKNGGKLVGFHGRAGETLYALGAYFTTTTTPLEPAKKLPAVGGDEGTAWDDCAYDGVKKVYVGQAQDGISAVKFVYDKGSEDIVGDEHGNDTLLGFEEFEVDADDYIVAVLQVSYDKIFGYDSDIITSITFSTFKGKTSPPYGLDTEKKFVLKGKNGGKLVGFHGRAGETLYALGAYFTTTTTPLEPAKKLPAVDGEEGTAWDDGAYDGVKKVYVGQAQDGISAVKFVYDKGSEDIVGDEHGNDTLLGFEEVILVKMAQKVEAQGGKGGNQWDDGSQHDAVTKIQAAAGGNGIQYVKFDYVKNGQTEEAPLRGVKGRSIAADPFVINHPEEHLVSVEGWYNPEGVVQGLKFKSNKKTSDVIGYEDGSPFTLQVEDKKIIGFHGFAGDYVHSLGAYFAPSISTPLTHTIKQEARGGTGGASWDDGVHDGVRKVHVGQGQDGVSSIKVVYEKDSQEVEGGEHGEKSLLGFETFEVDADDYIVAVQVTHDKVYGQESDIITSITFYTFKGKTSPPYGMETEKKFVLKDKNGGKLVGFHGRAGDVLHALGAHFVTTATPLTYPKTLSAIGGDEGTPWDDGAYDCVKKVYVGQSQDGISVVKFVYNKGAEDIIGGEHGKPTLLGFEEFELDYPSEYITSVHGTYDKIFGSKSSVITMLRFKTNKQISAPFGIEAGTPFELKEEGHKIVGFHGKVGDLLHKFGVHVLPITN